MSRTTTTYTAWKKKTVEAKPVNIASFSDFPDLVATPTKKKDSLAGISLASRLKETIAEEEAAQTRRMKREEKEEAWLRANCVSLPLKGYKGRTAPPPSEENEEEKERRVWMHENDIYVPMPMFRPKSVREQQRIAKMKKLQTQIEEANYTWQVSSEIEEMSDHESVSNDPLPEEEEMESAEEDSTLHNHE
jgi:hypothetical protein